MRGNQDSHILDWDLITKGQSNTTKACSSMDAGRADNKGIVFEDLIEKLLVAMFPRETWRRTIKSHDGKRDFVYPQNEHLPDQKWAECKNYNSNVSINVIAPTLIMGAIEKIGTILFFSYSPLNENAIEGILRYSKFTGKDVKIFDGNLLESLICKHHSFPGISEFFPKTDFKKDHETLKDKPLRIIKTLRNPNGNKLLSSHLFELGEPFSISIIVQNLSLDPIDYTVTVKTTNHDVLSFAEYEISCSLPGAAIKEHTIHSQALKSGSTAYTVKLISKQIRAGKCEVRGRIKIADEPYLFWTGKWALDAQRIATDHLADYQSTPLLIAAESGTGKSTLIDILLQDQGILEKYNVLKFDLNQSRNCCVRNVLSQAIGVNALDLTPKDQVEEDQLALNLLINTYAESAETLAETIFRFYDSQRPYLVVIDDVQRIGRAYIDLINELDTRFRRGNCAIYYLFALNEDIASKDDIITRLNWDAPYKNRACKTIKLYRFDQDDILAFMKHKFGLTEIDKFFSGFDNSIRPIELRSFCTNLKQQHIISPFLASVGDLNVYQIIDEFRFAEAVNTVLYANQSINAIWEMLKATDIPLYVLKYLYIVDTIGPEFRRKYHKQIDLLISLGILKEVDAQIVFCHDEIRKCVKDNLDFSEEDYADIYGDKNTDDTSKAICALSKMHRLQGGTAFLKEFFQRDQELTRTNQRDELCHLIFENLDKLYESELTAAALHFARFHFTSFNEEHGYITSYRFLKQVANAALSGLWDISEESVEDMAYFIKKYFDRALSTRNYQDCQDYYLRYDVVFQRLSCISSQRRSYWLAHYTNRLAIMCDRSSAPLETEPLSATSYYTLSDDYCVKAGSPADLLLQICIDDFNRHYVYRHDLTGTFATQTFNKLTDIKQNYSLSTSSLEYHILLLEYLKDKLCERKEPSEDFLSRIRNVRDACASPFYRLKLYMLEGYILIELNRLSEANILLSRAVELAYKNEMRQHIYKLTYIKAHLQIFQNSGNITGSSYKQIVLAFEQLMDTRGASPNDLMREIFLVVRLTSLIFPRNPEKVTSLTEKKEAEVQALFQKICNNSDHISSKDTPFSMQSYFVYRNISFPSI